VCGIAVKHFWDAHSCAALSLNIVGLVVGGITANLFSLFLRGIAAT
jgi:hypothetical protein